MIQNAIASIPGPDDAVIDRSKIPLIASLRTEENKEEEKTEDAEA